MGPHVAHMVVHEDGACLVPICLSLARDLIQSRLIPSDLSRDFMGPEEISQRWSLPISSNLVLRSRNVRTVRSSGRAR